jgi:hypothetical protein
MEQKMEFKDYLFSSHGADLGFSYVLPKNVRVILPCLRDSVSADVETDSKLWSAFITNPDLELNYLNNIMINIENPDKKYCVFSGNLIDGKNNIIPNLFIAPEEDSFKTGLIHAPLKLKRAFLTDYYSKTDDRQYLSGEVVDLDMNEFKRKLDDPLNNIGKERGFMRYFLNPGKIDAMGSRNLNFVVLNDPETYKSFDYFQREIYDKKGKQKLGSIVYEDSIIRDKDFRKPDDLTFDKEFLNKSDVTYDTIYFKDISNLEDKRRNSVVTEINRLKNSIEIRNNGYFISDIIRHICNQEENMGKFITITFSVCRVCQLFDKNLVQLRGSEKKIKKLVSDVKKGTFTNRLEFKEYREKFLVKDIESFQQSLQENYQILPEPDAETVENNNNVYNLMGGNIKKSENNKYKINYD